MADTYVLDHMKILAKHILEPVTDGVYRMGAPGDCIYVVYLAEFANRICVSGDMCLGANDYGIVSQPGYSLKWFGQQHLSECYLCSKFLRKEWQWVAAVEEINAGIKFDKFDDDEGWWTEHADRLKQFMSSPGWKYDTPTEGEFYEFMVDLGDDGCDLVGYDYPRGQAGWLCAIQQRYSELCKEMEYE